MPDPVKALFGTSPAVIAFCEDGVLVTYGEGAEEHLGRALAAKAVPAPLVAHADGDARRLAEMISLSAPRSGQEVKKFAELFEGRLQIAYLSVKRFSETQSVDACSPVVPGALLPSSWGGGESASVSTDLVKYLYRQIEQTPWVIRPSSVGPD